MNTELTATTRELIAAIERNDVPAARGFLVGLDRPALLAPDPAALLAASRPLEILARGHRWRVVTGSLWADLLELGRERPEQQVYVVEVAALEGRDLSELDQDGWRANQGNRWILPITWES